MGDKRANQKRGWDRSKFSEFPDAPPSRKQTNIPRTFAKFLTTTPNPESPIRFWIALDLGELVGRSAGLNVGTGLGLVWRLPRDGGTYSSSNFEGEKNT